MHNHDDKYRSRPGFEPGTPRLQAPVDTNEPSGQIMLFRIIDTHQYVSIAKLQQQLADIMIVVSRMLNDEHEMM